MEESNTESHASSAANQAVNEETERALEAHSRQVSRDIHPSSGRSTDEARAIDRHAKRDALLFQRERARKTGRRIITTSFTTW